MLKNSMKKDFVITILIWSLITILHFFTPIHHHLFPLHEIFRQFYYIPIIYGAFSFGLKGGLVTSSAVALVYFIHITCQWQLPRWEYINQLLEIILFIIIGFITGILVERLRREQTLYKETSEKLSVAINRMKEYQEQLIFSERMRSLGELAAGLAHEIKNPLSSIKSSVEVLEESVDKDSPGKEFLQILLKETSRLNKVVTNFLAFARPAKPEFLPCRIEEAIEPVIKLITPELEKKHISLEKKIKSDIIEISADSQQLQQVFLNLGLNAIQAMPEGGKLIIELEKDEKYIKITFQDTGCGISEDNLNKIFIPFFSTKKEGIGLGLATSYRIIENHGGNITVKSELQKGSSFIVKLPLRG